MWIDASSKRFFWTLILMYEVYEGINMVLQNVFGDRFGWIKCERELLQIDTHCPAGV